MGDLTGNKRFTRIPGHWRWQHDRSYILRQIIGTNGTQRVGAVFRFSESQIVPRDGVSFIYAEQACAKLDAEISAIAFDDLVTQTQDVWNDKVLSKISTPSASQNDSALLYTMLYGAFLIPTNKTGENPCGHRVNHISTTFSPSGTCIDARHRFGRSSNLRSTKSLSVP